jgi:hypothetical protein
MGALARLVNVLFSWDCALFSTLTMGSSYPGESFSSAAYRAELYGKFYGKARKPIDAFFAMLGQTDHCRIAYLSAKNNLPEDMR